jgi:F-type H+-transporting ATPase subunit delta
MNGPAAKRYARALFALANEGGRIEEEGAELAKIVEAFQDPQLAAFARSAAVDPAAKRDVVREVVERLGASDLVARFLGLLAEKNRLSILARIERQYRRLVDRKLGRVRARFVSAQPLSNEDERRIRELFERATGKKVLAEIVIDPALIGGVIVEIEGRIYDGSVRAQLDELKTALSG